MQRRPTTWSSLALVAALTGGAGCNLVFGLEPPLVVDAASDGSEDDAAVDAAVDAREPPVRTLVAAIALGADHTCALVTAGVTDSEIRCWGRNHVGQLGLGTTALMQVSPATAVALADKPTMVAAGNNHVCAILATGKVSCWGTSADGQLGYGNNSTVGDDAGEVAAAEPLDLTEAPGDLAAGGRHTCALLTNSVRCWGAGDRGQLGSGSTANVGDALTRLAPGPPVEGTGGVQQVVAGANHTCARFANGSAACWGADDRGQLGLGTNTDVGGMTGFSLTHLQAGIVVDLAAGADHTCAVLDTGTAVCWGANGSGQLGDGGQTDRTGAVTAATPKITLPGTPSHPIVKIVAGANHTCALTMDGYVYCWGANDVGQLGVGSVAPQIAASAATPVDLDGPAIAISAGLNHTCAIRADHALYCWGGGAYGKLGYGDDRNVGDGLGATPVSAGPVPF